MSNHPAAEKAARTLSLYIPTEGSWCEDGELSPDETRIIELVQTAIDVVEHDNRSVIASQQIVLREKRARIEKLEGALKRIQKAVDVPELHQMGLGCGVEDRDLYDRYGCAEFGWEDAAERFTEWAKNEADAALAPVGKEPKL